MRIAASIRLTSPAELVAALAGLQRAAEVDLRCHALPSLYDSGVRYRRERPMAEHWQLPSQTIVAGVGDCEDLSAWRAAELKNAGENAEIVLIRAKPRLWHVAVRRESGAIEDPSRILGMQGPG